MHRINYSLNQKLVTAAAIVGTGLGVSKGDTNNLSTLVPPNSPAKEMHGIAQGFINDQGQHQGRLQVKNDTWHFTGEYAFTEESPEALTFAAKYTHQGFTIDGGMRELIEDFQTRAAFRYDFKKDLNLALIALSGTGSQRFVAKGTLSLGEQITAQAVGDNEGNARARIIATQRYYQASIGGGVHSGDGVLSASFNTSKVWISGDIGPRSATRKLFSNSGLRFAVGNIDAERSRKADDVYDRGKNVLERFGDVSGLPDGLKFGRDPEFLFGGRSTTTFVDKKPGSVAALIDFRTDRTLFGECGVRLPDLLGLASPVLSVSHKHNLLTENGATGLEFGSQFRQAYLRVRGEVDNHGVANFGAFVEVKF